jgi:hypothetical protein
MPAPDTVFSAGLPGGGAARTTASLGRWEPNTFHTDQTTRARATTGNTHFRLMIHLSFMLNELSWLIST